MMKSIYVLLITILTSSISYSQAPEKMSYQAVIRDASDNLISSASVAIKISILQGSSNGTSVYTESHTTTTNLNGLVSIEIGTGSIINGTFSSIDWENGPYYLKTETDPTGGNTYSITGVSQLLSIPYALYAKSAGAIQQEQGYIYLKKKSTNQNIPNNTNTQINNYDEIDNNGISLNNNTGTVTFNTAGVFIITAQISYAPSVSNLGKKLFWFNCSSQHWPSRIASTEITGESNRMTTSFVGKFEIGDEISLSTWQGTGNTLFIPNSTQVFDQVFLNIEKIR